MEVHGQQLHSRKLLDVCATICLISGTSEPIDDRQADLLHEAEADLKSGRELLHPEVQMIVISVRQKQKRAYASHM